MSTWDKRYTDRVQLLVEILPTLAKETRFALKGGTAINLFEHDLPRLSVDIDLTWLPMQDYAQDASQISDALEGLGRALGSAPLRLQVQTSAPERGGLHKQADSESWSSPSANRNDPGDARFRASSTDNGCSAAGPGGLWLCLDPGARLRGFIRGENGSSIVEAASARPV